jgi:hypothetical protein
MCVCVYVFVYALVCSYTSAPLQVREVAKGNKELPSVIYCSSISRYVGRDSAVAYFARLQLHMQDIGHAHQSQNSKVTHGLGKGQGGRAKSPRGSC